MKKITIENQICGYNGCNKPAKTQVVFSIGFSAKFCEECTKALTDDNIGLLDGVGK